MPATEETVSKDLERLQNTKLAIGGNAAQSRLWVDTEFGALNIKFNAENPAFKPEKAKAALSELHTLFGSVDNGHDTIFWGNVNKLKPQFLDKATDILVKHGFVSETEKPAFIQTTRKGQLQGKAKLLLEAEDGILSDYAARSATAKPFITLIGQLAQLGDVATLPPEQLSAMRSIAEGNPQTLRQLVPSEKWQVDFAELCKNWQPEIEAAIRQESRTLETGADGQPLTRNAPESKGRLR